MTCLVLPHVGKVVEAFLCDEHGMELIVKSERHGMEYVCYLEQCLDGAHRAQVGDMVLIEERDGEKYPYYLTPCQI